MADVTADGSQLARPVEDLHGAAARDQRGATRGRPLRGLQPVLDEVIEACQRLSKADQGALYLLRDGLLHSVAHHGLPEAVEYDTQHPHALDRTTAAGRAAVTREPVHIPDIEEDPGTRTPARDCTGRYSACP